MPVTLAHVVRSHVEHYRGELLSLRKKTDLAITLGDAFLADQLSQQAKRTRISLAALEKAQGDWMARNAREARQALEADA